MKEITKEIEWFRNFLNESYGSLRPFLEAYNWSQYLIITDDWMRLNWQVLVGGILLEKPNCLKPLSNNYHCFYDKDLSYNYAVVTYIKRTIYDVMTNEEIPQNQPLLLDLFLTQVKRDFLGRSLGIQYSSEPPFDMVVLLSDQKNTYYTHFKDLRFYLVEWP